MHKDEIKIHIAKRVAKEIKAGDVVNLGIGLPTLIPSYLPEGISVILQSENGIVGAVAGSKEVSESSYIVDAGGQPAAVVQGGCFIDFNVSFDMIRGGHVDVTVLGALEVDQYGNLANWVIPGKRVPGMGGAMDLVVGAKRVIVAMEHTAKGTAKILKQCKLPFTAIKCVDLIVTEMGVFELTETGLLLTEINPAFSIEDIQKATEADFIIREKLIAM